MDKYQKIVDRVELFNGLNAHDVEKIFHKGLTIRVAKGETVFFKDTVGNQMYIILGGKIGVFDGSKRLATLSTGDMFGEMALVNEEPRSASALAMEDSHMFVLNESTFQKLMTKRVSVHMLLNIIKTLSHRLQKSNKKLAKAMETIQGQADGK